MTFAIAYLSITHVLIPLLLLVRIVTYYRDYSVKSLINIFVVSFLIFLPLVQLSMLGLGAVGHQKETVDVFISSIPLAALISIFGGLIGLLLNSTYIFVLRLTEKK